MQITVGLYALAAGLLTTTLIAATPTDASRWRIVVEVENRTNFSDAVLIRAERWVEKVYEKIGISIVWSPPVSLTAPGLRLRLILIPPPAEKFFFRGDDMGTALGNDGTGPRRVYVSPHRIRRLISPGVHIPASLRPGCVIAHEIGHLLLPPNPHSPVGIMRPTFQIADFVRADHGGIQFTTQQAQYIRSAIEERMK